MTDLPLQPPLHDRVTVPNTYQEQKVTRPSHLDIGSLTVTLMSSDTGTIASVPAAAENRFSALAEEWYLGTMFVSSYLEKILHPAYQKILRLDKAAIPLILRELQYMPNDWFWALRILAEDDPVRPQDAGDMQAMADAWISWGRDKGYIA